MLNGNIREFVDKLWGGEELIYRYKDTFFKDMSFKKGNTALKCKNRSSTGKCSGM